MCMIDGCSCCSSLQNFRLKWTHTYIVFQLHNFIHFFCHRCILTSWHPTRRWFICHDLLWQQLCQADHSSRCWNLVQLSPWWNLLFVPVWRCLSPMEPFWKMMIHLGQPGTPHPCLILPPPSLGALQLQILMDRCIDCPVQPNARDNTPVCPRGGLGDPVLAQTLASSYSPGCHCQSVPKVHTLQHYIH